MKILLVDDESLARERLLRLLKKVQPGAEILQASSGAVAVNMVRETVPDLIFLDIRMPAMDGLEVASQLDTLEQAPAVIFCTAFDEYALEALKHQAVAYLLKPVRQAELVKALESAGRVNRMQLATLRGSGLARTQVSSQTHRGLETVALRDIECFLAEDKYVSACTANSSLLIPDTLKDLESEFSQEFVRVHRNALVSLRHMLRLVRDDSGSWCVVLSGVGVRPGVSRRHLADAKKRMKQR